MVIVVKSSECLMNSEERESKRKHLPYIHRTLQLPLLFSPVLAVVVASNTSRKLALIIIFFIIICFHSAHCTFLFPFLFSSMLSLVLVVQKKPCECSIIYLHPAHCMSLFPFPFFPFPSSMQRSNASSVILIIYFFRFLPLLS